MIEKIAWGIVGLVVGVWLVTTLILPLAVVGYEPPASIGTVMASLAGGAGAYLFARRAPARDQDEKKSKPRRRPARVDEKLRRTRRADKNGGPL